MESVHDKSYNFSSSIYHVQSEKVPYTKHWWHHAKSVVQMSFNPLPASDLCIMGWNNFWRRDRNIFIFFFLLAHQDQSRKFWWSGPVLKDLNLLAPLAHYSMGLQRMLLLSFQPKGFKTNSNYYLKRSNNTMKAFLLKNMTLLQAIRNSNGLRFKNTPSKTIWVHCVLFDSEPCQPNFSGFNTTCWIRMNSRKYLVVQLCQSNWKCFKSISSLFHAYGTKRTKSIQTQGFYN